MAETKFFIFSLADLQRPYNPAREFFVEDPCNYNVWLCDQTPCFFIQEREPLNRCACDDCHSKKRLDGKNRGVYRKCTLLTAQNSNMVTRFSKLDKSETLRSLSSDLFDNNFMDSIWIGGSSQSSLCTSSSFSEDEAVSSTQISKNWKSSWPNILPFSQAADVYFQKSTDMYDLGNILYGFPYGEGFGAIKPNNPLFRILSQVEKLLDFSFYFDYMTEEFIFTEKRKKETSDPIEEMTQKGLPKDHCFPMIFFLNQIIEPNSLERVIIKQSFFFESKILFFSVYLDKKLVGFAIFTKNLLDMKIQGKFGLFVEERVAFLGLKQSFESTEHMSYGECRLTQKQMFDHDLRKIHLHTFGFTNDAVRPKNNNLCSVKIAFIKKVINTSWLIKWSCITSEKLSMAFFNFPIPYDKHLKPLQSDREIDYWMYRVEQLRNEINEFTKKTHDEKFHTYVYLRDFVNSLLLDFQKALYNLDEVQKDSSILCTCKSTAGNSSQIYLDFDKLKETAFMLKPINFKHLLFLDPENWCNEQEF